MRQLRFAKRIATGNNRLHCCSARRGISTHQGWRFSAGCSPASRQYWQLSDVHDGVPDQSPFDVINNPVLFRFTACLPFRIRLPVRLLPSCTTICACCIRWSLWHCLTRDRHTAAAVRLRQHVANQRPAKSLRPQCNFLPSSALMRPATTTPRFCRQRTSRAVFHFPDEALHAATVCVLPPVAQPLLPAKPGVVHFAYSGSANGQLIWTPPA